MNIETPLPITRERQSLPKSMGKPHRLLTTIVIIILRRMHKVKNRLPPISVVTAPADPALAQRPSHHKAPRSPVEHAK